MAMRVQGEQSALTDMGAFERALREAIHRYPGDASYRRSGQSWPQIGDVALCGHVKDVPPDPSLKRTRATRVTCERCAVLWALR